MPLTSNHLDQGVGDVNKSYRHPPTGGETFEGEVESNYGHKEKLYAKKEGGVEDHPPTGSDVVEVDIEDEDQKEETPEEEEEEEEEEEPDYTFLGLTRHKCRNFLGEFLGTMILIVIGNGANAQNALSQGTAGSYLAINFGWAMGVFMAVYVSGGISGAHLNPAVSLAFAIFRKFPWKQVPVYWAGQILGAFTGAAIIYGNYRSAFTNFFEMHGVGKEVVGEFATAGIFATYPQPFLSTAAQFFDQVLGTAVLILVIFASSDQNNMPAGKNGPLVVAFTVLGIGISLGWQTGYAINPARDLGPRLLSLVAGWGSDTFKAYGAYSWVAIIGTFSGAIVGGLIYHFFIDSPLNEFLMVHKEKDKPRKHRFFRHDSPKDSPPDSKKSSPRSSEDSKVVTQSETIKEANKGKAPVHASPLPKST